MANRCCVKFIKQPRSSTILYCVVAYNLQHHGSSSCSCALLYCAIFLKRSCVSFICNVAALSYVRSQKAALTDHSAEQGNGTETLHGTFTHNSQTLDHILCTQ